MFTLKLRFDSLELGFLPLYVALFRSSPDPSLKWANWSVSDGDFFFFLAQKYQSTRVAAKSLIFYY